MNNPKLLLIEKAKKVVEGSTLSPEDKQLVVERIPYAPFAMLEVFLETCAGDQFTLDVLVRSLKRKLMAGDDPIKLHQIIVEERKALRKFIHAPA